MANAPATASYTNDPSNVPIDFVRLRLGDTNCAAPWLTDAEIRYFIGDTTNPIRAAANAARAIVAKVASRVDFSHGPVKKSLSQLSTNFEKLARRLDNEANLGTVAPLALGTEIAEKQAADNDTSKVQPIFRKGETDNPRAGGDPGPATADPSEGP